MTIEGHHRVTNLKFSPHMVQSFSESVGTASVVVPHEVDISQSAHITEGAQLPSPFPSACDPECCGRTVDSTLKWKDGMVPCCKDCNRMLLLNKLAIGVEEPRITVPCKSDGSPCVCGDGDPECTPDGSFQARLTFAGQSSSEIHQAAITTGSSSTTGATQSASTIKAAVPVDGKSIVNCKDSQGSPCVCDAGFPGCTMTEFDPSSTSILLRPATSHAQKDEL